MRSNPRPDLHDSPLHPDGVDGPVEPIVRPETIGDHAGVRELNRLAFGGDDEARLVDALREAGYARISMVAEEYGRLVGHILFSALTIATSRGEIQALSLAPMAVVPSRQRKGIGSALVGEGLRACREAGHRIVVVLGHPEFYPRFGFSAKLAEPLESPYSGPAFMAVELVPNALQGIEGEVRYPPPFQDL
ncbi:MAG: GNAT family N-acetyltransferase [Isosphaeraceae bacterium]